MTECLWSYAEWTPYEVLRVPSNASISEIRTAFKKMALHTHPDKQHSSQGAHISTTPGSNTPINECDCTASSASPVTAAASPSFHAVKAASEILLDPFLRASYDAFRSHALVRQVGAISDTYSLSEDFELVAASDAPAEVRVYQCECRCGGVYEVVLFAEPSAALSSAPRTLRCECDSCSLVVEVVVE